MEAHIRPRSVDGRYVPHSARSCRVIPSLLCFFDMDKSVGFGDLSYSRQKHLRSSRRRHFHRPVFYPKTREASRRAATRMILNRQGSANLQVTSQTQITPQIAAKLAEKLLQNCANNLLMSCLSVFLTPTQAATTSPAVHSRSSAIHSPSMERGSWDSIIRMLAVRHVELSELVRGLANRVV